MSTALVPSASSSLADPPTPAAREPRDAPDSRKLATELRATIMDWHTHNRFEKIAEAQRIRACEHSQRTGTGRYGPPAFGAKNVFPWHGAPDGDSLLVDQIIREDVDIHMLAWWMGQRSVRPRDVMNDAAHRKSEVWRHLLDFELDQCERQRADALELFWNCMGEINCCVWHEDWSSQWRRGRKTMSFQGLVEATVQQISDEYAQNAQPPPADLADMVTGELISRLYDAEMSADLVQRVRAVDPLCPVKEAKNLVAAWRKGDQGDVPYFAPVPMPGKAAPRALIPGIHCLWPVLTEHHQQPQLDIFEWLTGAEVMTRSTREGWNSRWTDELLERHKGMVVDWSTLGMSGITYDGTALNGLDFSTTLDVQALRNADLYQIAIRKDWGVDSDGLPSPYRTVYHGQMKGVALSECDPNGTGRHDFIIFNREVRSSYSADFRGIAHHLNSHQVGEKQLSDGITAQALLRAGPPVVDTMESGVDGLKPFARMAGDARSAARGGDFKFMQVPDVSPEVIQWAEMNRARVDQLYMRGPEVDPDAKRARRMRQLSRACLFYREMEMLLCQNAREDVRSNGTLTLGSVGGVPVNTVISIDDLEGELDIQHKCDIAATDLELAKAKIDMIASVIGFDRYGTTDFNKLYRILMGWVDPEIASAAITTLEQATDREKGETELLISKVVSGNLMMDELEKDAGNPQMRIELIKQWQSLAENQQVMAMRPLVAEQFEKLMEHYAFQYEQKDPTQNPATGRVRGTNPELKNAVPAQGGAMQPA